MGEFRIPRVGPGSYLLMVHTYPSPNWNNGDLLVDTWYPGTASAADAALVEVTEGATVTGLDITLQDVKPVTVAGTVFNQAGRPFESGIVAVFAERNGTRIHVPLAEGSNGRLGPDGTFRLRLPPGEYWLTASTTGSGGIGSVSLAPGAPEPSEEEAKALYAAMLKEVLTHSGFASMKVTVGGEALEGITMKLDPPALLTGRFVFEGRQPPSDALMHASIDLVPAVIGSGCQVTSGEQLGLEPASGSTVDLYGSPGNCIPSVRPPPGWYLKGIQLGGADVTQRIVTLEPGRSPGEMQVLLTERRNELSFSVTDARGAATDEYVALVFTANESVWPAIQTLYQAMRVYVPGVKGRSAAPGLTFEGMPQGPDSDFSLPLSGLFPGEYLRDRGRRRGLARPRGSRGAPATLREGREVPDQGR